MDFLIDFQQLGEVVSLYRDTKAIVKNKYNVLTVAQAKGLEFERVVVLEKNMTQNQLYVACTRAIKQLTVVSS